jgi:polyhydroxyalkanoate synthase
MLRSETAGDPERTARALDGLRRYQEAERRPPPEPMPVVAERHGAMLRDYGGSGGPVLFVPSLINPPNILDLSEDRSLLRWLAGRGVRPILLDWGWEVESRRALSVAGHVEEILLPLIRGLGEPVSLVGYCLGGTMAISAAGGAPVRAVAAIAAPWRFSGFGDEARAGLASLWRAGEETARRLGLFPMELLQSAFWSLDPARTVAKFERAASMPAGSAEEAAFVLLEDWANDGPPLPEAAARELFEGFFAADLPGTGAWQVDGRAADPAALSVPFLNIVSASDRIVPAASAAPAGERLDLAQGHVGMVVGSGAKKALWEPLALWLSRAGSTC